MIVSRRRPRQRGFTLIEVLVALIVTAVGLLGLAKMQLLAMSSTKEAGSRALIALQAGSLASAMYANGAYWASASVASSVGATGNVVTGLGVSDSAGCIAKCTGLVLAATDMQTWATAMNNQFPTYNATVTCVSTSLPVNCTISITWIELQKAIGNVEGVTRTSTFASKDAAAVQSFSLYVQP